MMLMVWIVQKNKNGWSRQFAVYQLKGRILLNRILLYWRPGVTFWKRWPLFERPTATVLEAEGLFLPALMPILSPIGTNLLLLQKETSIVLYQMCMGKLLLLGKYIHCMQFNMEEWLGKYVYCAWICRTCEIIDRIKWKTYLLIIHKSHFEKHIWTKVL